MESRDPETWRPSPVVWIWALMCWSGIAALVWGWVADDEQLSLMDCESRQAGGPAETG